MLQQDHADDYVIATGQTWSVRDFLDHAFSLANLNWEDYVEIDPRYLRPTEVDALRGDASKAQILLGWKPRIPFHDIIKEMVIADCKQENVLSKLKL